jgi:hypothetical protein
MRINKVRKIARAKINEYLRIDSIINGLEEQKERAEGKDVNSFIRSKNKVSRGVEGQAINNITIDEKIENYKLWKELIHYLLEDLKLECEVKAKVIEFKIRGGAFEKAEEEVYVSKETARNYFNEFVLEVGIMAVKRNLIEIE